MNAEFQWWLLLVGLVIGALLVFLIMADFSRSADEQADVELAREAAWIADQVPPATGPLAPDLVEEILRLNRDWLAGPALHPDEVDPPDPPDPVEPLGSANEASPAESPSGIDGSSSQPPA
ncbi:MAG: hypothetical protein ACRDGQ_11020 [Candidatus Limnocylindrales bacterium]